MFPVEIKVLKNLARRSVVYIAKGFGAISFIYSA